MHRSSRSPLLCVAALVVGCTSGEPPPPPVAPVDPAEASAAAATALCRLATAGQLACSAQGPVATIGGRQLRTDVAVTGFLALPATSVGSGAQARELPGEVQLTLKLDLSVDGTPLASGTAHEVVSHIDVPAARATALDTAVQRWAMSTGLAAVDAVGGDPAAPVLGAAGLAVPAQQPGGVTAWAGFPALRGVGFDPNLALQLGPNVASMGAALGPYLEGIGEEGLHHVVVKARLGGGGAPGPCGIIPPVTLADGATASIVPLAGEVQVDGVVTGTICELSEPVAWPLPQGGAVLEWDQAFVVAPAPTP